MTDIPYCTVPTHKDVGVSYNVTKGNEKMNDYQLQMFNAAMRNREKQIQFNQRMDEYARLGLVAAPKTSNNQIIQQPYMRRTGY